MSHNTSDNMQDSSSLLMRGEVTQKVTKVQRLDGLGSPSQTSKHATQASGSPIVMASPRPPIVFSGGNANAPVMPSPMSSPRPSDPYSPDHSPGLIASNASPHIPVGFSLPQKIVQGGDAGESLLQDQDGAHNPRDFGRKKRASALVQDNEIALVLSARKEKVCGHRVLVIHIWCHICISCLHILCVDILSSYLVSLDFFYTYANSA